MKTVINSSDNSNFDFSELKKYTGLLRYLSLRDVKVRYKQTIMGFGWSLIRPLINILIFGSLSCLIDRSTSPLNRFVEVSGGVVLWQFLSTVILEVSNSLSANANILTKVYFPKLILPLSNILVCLIDFFIAFLFFLILFLFVEGPPSPYIILLPFILSFGLIFSLSLGLIFATASVKYRDVKFILPFVVQILFYVSPVFLSTKFVMQLNVPLFVKNLYLLNPLVFILDSYKACLYGNFQNLDMVYGGLSALITMIIFFLSLKYFLKFEKSFADFI